MKDLNYFIAQASNSTQREFELDFADVIHMYDVSQLELMTEDNKCLVLNWDEDGRYKSYSIDQEATKRVIVFEIIDALKEIDVDGETMQYIIEKVGMKEQMLKQLVLSSEGGPLEELLSEWEAMYGEMLEF